MKLRKARHRIWRGKDWVFYPWKRISGYKIKHTGEIGEIETFSFFESAFLSEMDEFTKRVDPLRAENLLRRMTEICTDNGDGTMTYRPRRLDWLTSKPMRKERWDD